MTKILSAYDRNRVTLNCTDADGNHDGRTEQHHKDDVKIQNILKRYDKTGLITHVNAATARYGEFTDVNEYQEALNLVIDAQNSFDELPSDIRRRFGNDPGQFFEFATNPDNADEMVKLGLAEIIPEDAPIEVKVIGDMEKNAADIAAE